MGKLPPEAPEPCLRPRTCTWLAALLAVGVALSRLPALLLGAAAEQPPERVFLGFEGDAAGVVDLHYYASYVEEARARPKLLLTDRATTEPQRGRVISLYFSALGLFVRGSGLSVPAAWNIAKILVILLFFFVLWQVLGLFFASAGQRLLAFALVAVGGGFGWLLLGLQELAGNDGGTWYLADLEKDGAIGYSTFGYLFHPQALLAQTCFLAALLLWARWRAGRGMRWLAAALICAILVFMIHGPSSPVFYLALLAAPAIPLFFRLEARASGERLRGVAAFALPAALAAAYVLWARGDPVFSGFADTYARLSHLSEPVFWYPAGYGLVFLLAMQGLVHGRRIGEPERWDLLLGWLLAALVAATNPLIFAWKFQFALHVPLCIIAAAGAPAAWERLTCSPRLAPLAGRKLLAGALLVAFSGISSLFLFGRTLAGATSEALYTSRAELDALGFLARQPPGALLGRYRTGYLAIHYTPHKAYLAHYTGTLQPEGKDEAVQAFYRAGTPLADKRRLLQQGGIRYVVEGPRERERGEVDPALGLHLLYEKDGVRIHQVLPAR